MRMKRFRAAMTVFSVVVLVATVARAQGTFSMTGKAATGSGLFVRLPAVGDAACPSVTALRAASPTMAPQMVPVNATKLTPKKFNVVLNPKGCIPGGPAKVTVNGSGGFAVPVGFFNQPVPGTLNVVPVPNTPMVIQLATSFGFTGPRAAPKTARNARRHMTGTALSMTNAYAAWRQLKHSAWMTQTGRLGLNFTACPDAGTDIHCTFPSQGSIPGVVKVTGGPGGGFGGTFGLVLATGTTNPGSLVVKAGPMETIIIPRLVGNASRAAGRGYAVFDTDQLLAGQLWYMYELTMDPDKTDHIVSMVTTYLGPGAAGLNKNYGFPWTTGNVVIRGTGINAVGNPVGGTFSIAGFDCVGATGANCTKMVTGMGQRNIQLVAGHIAQSTVQGANGTPNYSVIRLPEPSGGVSVVAAVIAILGIAAWRARKMR